MIPSDTRNSLVIYNIWYAMVEAFPENGKPSLLPVTVIQYGAQICIAHPFMKLQIIWLQSICTLQPSIKPLKGQLNRTVNGGFISEVDLFFPVDVIEDVQAFVLDHSSSGVIVAEKF